MLYTNHCVYHMFKTCTKTFCRNSVFTSSEMFFRDAPPCRLRVAIFRKISLQKISCLRVAELPNVNVETYVRIHLAVKAYVKFQTSFIMLKLNKTIYNIKQAYIFVKTSGPLYPMDKRPGIFPGPRLSWRALAR